MGRNSPKCPNSKPFNDQKNDQKSKLTFENPIDPKMTSNSNKHLENGVKNPQNFTIQNDQ